MDNFKFVKLPTIFPLPYGTTTIKGSLSDDNVGDALCKITKRTGPLWSKLLLTWSKPFANTVLANCNAKNLPPQLRRDQQWANNMLIHGEGLADDKEEDWNTIKAITNVLATIMVTPTASSVVASAMANSYEAYKFVSADQYVVNTPGRLLSGYGKETTQSISSQRTVS